MKILISNYVQKQFYRSITKMKNLTTQSVLVIFCVFIFASIDYLLAVDKEGSFNVQKGDLLDVKIEQGNITVNTWDKSEVKIFAKNIEDDESGLLTMEQKSGKVEVRFKGDDSDEFFLELTIPADLMIDLKTGGGNVNINNDLRSKVTITSGGGNISAKIIGGEVNITTAGGNVNVSTVSGNAEISTGGGNIKLDGATGKVEANTGGGNIDLKNIKGSIEANTGAGNITAELSPDGKSSSNLNSGVGSITIYIPESAKATIVATASDFKWGDSAKDSDSIKSEFESYDVTKNRTGNTFESVYELNGGGSKIELNVGLGDINIKKLKM